MGKRYYLTIRMKCKELESLRGESEEEPEFEVKKDRNNSAYDACFSP
jgi:hypothetical protein